MSTIWASARRGPCTASLTSRRLRTKLMARPISVKSFSGGWYSSMAVSRHAVLKLKGHRILGCRPKTTTATRARLAPRVSRPAMFLARPRAVAPLTDPDVSSMMTTSMVPNVHVVGAERSGMAQTWCSSSRRTDSTTAAVPPLDCCGDDSVIWSGAVPRPGDAASTATSLWRPFLIEDACTYTSFWNPPRSERRSARPEKS